MTKWSFQERHETSNQDVNEEIGNELPELPEELEEDDSGFWVLGWSGLDSSN